MRGTFLRKLKTPASKTQKGVDNMFREHSVRPFFNSRFGSDGWIVTFHKHPGFKVHFRRVVMGYCKTRLEAFVYKSDTYAPLHYWRDIADTFSEGIEHAGDWLTWKYDPRMLPTLEIAGIQRGDICDLEGIGAVVIVALYESVYDGGRDRCAFRSLDGSDRGVVVLPSRQIKLESRATIYENITPKTSGKPGWTIRFHAARDRSYEIVPDGNSFDVVMWNDDNRSAWAWDGVPNLRSVIHIARVNALASRITFNQDNPTIILRRKKSLYLDHFTFDTKTGRVTFQITNWAGSKTTGSAAGVTTDSLPHMIANRIVNAGLSWSLWT